MSGPEKTSDARARRGARWFLVAAAAAVLLKLWLVSAQPILAIGLGADLDDRLFLSLANNLLKGQWLGPYSFTTLVKGCFYSMWIAFVHGLRLPLLLSQHLLYLAAVISFILAIRPSFPRPWALLLLFALLWFNPSTYSVHALRVMREGIYPALTLFVIAGTVGILARWNRPARVLWRWLIGTGVALAAFWQTREEGVWLMPLVVLVLGWVAVKLWRNHHPRKRSRSLMCLVPLAILGIGDMVIAGINKVNYGVFTTVEFKAPDFLAAYGALNRVKPTRWEPHVLVTREAREKVYAVSPSFAELRPFLEGPVGRGWHCAHIWSDVKEGEIAGGCFMWALREAAARAGHHVSGTTAMAYYRKVAQDIDGACADGKLECLPARASMMPPWQDQFNRPFLQTMARAPGFLAGFVGIVADPQPSRGSQASLALFRDLTQNRLAPIGKTAENEPSRSAKMDSFKIHVLNACVTLFHTMMPLLALLALALFCVRTMIDLRARRLSDLWIVEAALLAVIVARLTILSILEVTAFPGIDPLYLSSAYPVLIAFVVLALQEGITTASDWKTRWGRR
jgi:hypothetical protein